MDHQKNIHLYWGIALLVVIFVVRFYYVGLLEKQEVRHMEENNAVLVTKDLARQFDGQNFDGRSLDNGGHISDKEKIWQVYDNDASYENLGLYSGVVLRDTISNIVWSAPSLLPVDNDFTLNDGVSSGGGANNLCSKLRDDRFGGLSSWKVPTQKQLMQAYINGAGSSLVERSNYLWSSTEFFGDESRAWRVNLMSGDVISSPKNVDGNNYVVCVAHN